MLLSSKTLSHFGLFQHRLQIQARLVSQKISPFAMEKLPQDTKEKTNRESECVAKSVSDSDTNKRPSDHIIPHLLKLYAASATSRDFEIYAPDASFEDPLMHAQGVPQIKSAFYSISKVFSESKIVEYSVEEKEISPGKQEILIDNKQHYKIMGRNINMISLIKLYVENGKVVRHEDWWDKQPPRGRDTTSLPLLGRFIEITRRGSMLATHAMMGFGKD